MSVALPLLIDVESDKRRDDCLEDETFLREHAHWLPEIWRPIIICQLAKCRSHSHRTEETKQEMRFERTFPPTKN